MINHDDRYDSMAMISKIHRFQGLVDAQIEHHATFRDISNKCLKVMLKTPQNRTSMDIPLIIHHY